MPPPTSSASRKASIITQVAAGGDLPFIDLTGKVDVSGLTDTARGQVEVDGKVYGMPARLLHGRARRSRTRSSPSTALDAADDLGRAEGRRPGAQGRRRDADRARRQGLGPPLLHVHRPRLVVLGPEGFEQLRRGERKLTDPDVVAAAQLLLDLQPFYNAGFEATDYVTAKAIFAKGQGAMMVAGTADFTGYREVNPEADLSFIAWPGPEAGKNATTTGMELLYTVSGFASPEKQEAATKFVNWLATQGGAATRLRQDRAAGPQGRHRVERSDPQADGRRRAGGDVIGLVRPAGDERQRRAAPGQPGRSLDRPPHGAAVRRRDAGVDQADPGGGNADGLTADHARSRPAERTSARDRSGARISEPRSPPVHAIRPRSGRRGSARAGDVPGSGCRIFWFILPALLGYGVLFVYPTIRAFYLSFFDWSGVGPIGDSDRARQLRRTAAQRPVPERRAATRRKLFLFIFVFQNTVSLGLALMLNRRSRDDPRLPGHHLPAGRSCRRSPPASSGS